MADSHYDPLHDDDIRSMLEEKGVATRNLRTRQQLIARLKGIEAGDGSRVPARRVDGSHQLRVLYCSG
jgi:hypothetical protein